MLPEKICCARNQLEKIFPTPSNLFKLALKAFIAPLNFIIYAFWIYEKDVKSFISCRLAVSLVFFTLFLGEARSVAFPLIDACARDQQ